PCHLTAQAPAANGRRVNRCRITRPCSSRMRTLTSARRSRANDTALQATRVSGEADTADRWKRWWWPPEPVVPVVPVLDPVPVEPVPVDPEPVEPPPVEPPPVEPPPEGDVVPPSKYGSDAMPRYAENAVV